MKITDYMTGIQHLGLPVKDMDATLEFYEKLGFEIIYSTVYEGIRVNFLRFNNLVVEAYEQEETVMCYGALDHVAIDVSDVEKVYEIICDMGMNNMNDEIHYLPYWANGFKYFKIEGPDKECIEFGQIL